jgi:hypothetical protein
MSVALQRSFDMNRSDSRGNSSGQRGKKRPAVVLQSDAYASTSSTVSRVVVAEVAKNLTMKDDPACQFIDVSTSEGKFHR